MHILILPSWYSTPDKPTHGSFFRDQAVALSNAGVRVGLINPDVSYSGKLKDITGRLSSPEQSMDSGVRVVFQRCKYWRRGGARSHAKRVLELGLTLFENYINCYGLPDLVHVHSALYAGGVAVKIKEKYGVPFVLTEHSTAYARKRIRKSKRILAEKIVANSSALYAVSRPFSQLLEDFFKGTQWQVMPNVLDRIFIQADLGNENAIKAADTFNFLNVCYFSEKKGLFNLLYAFSEVALHNPAATLTLAGDGDLRPELEQLVTKLELSDKVRFTGLLSRNQVLEEMKQCDCFVLSSDYETFGVVLIEANAVGKPVVATRCGGPEDIVSDGNGILVSNRDTEGLASGMKYVIENNYLYDAEKIRDACIRTYGPSAIAKQLIKEYSKFIK